MQYHLVSEKLQVFWKSPKMQWKLFLKQPKQEPSTWKTELWDRFSRHIFEISDATHPKAWEASQEVSSIHIDLRGRAFFSHPGFPSPPSTIMPVFWAKVTKWDDERWAKNQILYNHQASSSIIKHPAKYCRKFDFVFKIQTQIGVLSKCFVLKMEVKLELCAKDPQPGHTWSFVGTWGAVGPEGNGETEKFADKRRPSRKIIWFQNDPKWAYISVHEEKTDLLTGIARRIRMILQLRGGHKNEGHQSW